MRIDKGAADERNGQDDSPGLLEVKAPLVVDHLMLHHGRHVRGPKMEGLVLLQTLLDCLCCSFFVIDF